MQAGGGDGGGGVGGGGGFLVSITNLGTCCPTPGAPACSIYVLNVRHAQIPDAWLVYRTLQDFLALAAELKLYDPSGGLPPVEEGDIAALERNRQGLQEWTQRVLASPHVQHNQLLHSFLCAAPNIAPPGTVIAWGEQQQQLQQQHEQQQQQFQQQQQQTQPQHAHQQQAQQAQQAQSAHVGGGTAGGVTRDRNASVDEMHMDDLFDRGAVTEQQESEQLVEEYSDFDPEDFEDGYDPLETVMAGSYWENDGSSLAGSAAMGSLAPGAVAGSAVMSFPDTEGATMMVPPAAPPGHDGDDASSAAAAAATGMPPPPPSSTSAAAAAATGGVALTTDAAAAAAAAAAAGGEAGLAVGGGESAGAETAVGGGFFGGNGVSGGGAASTGFGGVSGASAAAAAGAIPAPASPAGAAALTGATGSGLGFGGIPAPTAAAATAGGAAHQHGHQQQQLYGGVGALSSMPGFAALGSTPASGSLTAAASASHMARRGTLSGKTASLERFKIIRVIGKGSFGKVFLVRDKETRRLYAMKVLKKGHVIKRNQVDHTRTERNVLGVIAHPYIVGLNMAFQTRDKLFFVLDYCAGGELFFHLGRVGRFSEPQARFYAAEITLAIEYLHSLGIVYRDLKPENVLLDSDGHIRLTDFGLSKEGITDNVSGAHSFCGTPEYLAPEILDRSGHGRAVDWWSLGALLYEMLTGLPPFYSKDRSRLFQKIRSADLNFPDFMSPNARDLLNGLLTRDPSARLGSREADGREVRNHPFFADIDWDRLSMRQLPPSWTPEVAGSLDTSQFDREFTSMPIFTPDQKESHLAASVDNTFEGFTFTAQAGSHFPAAAASAAAPSQQQPQQQQQQQDEQSQQQQQLQQQQAPTAP